MAQYVYNIMAWGYQELQLNRRKTNYQNNFGNNIDFITTRKRYNLNKPPILTE